MTIKELKQQIENLKDDTIVLISINDIRALDIELIKHSKCGRKPSDENCTFIYLNSYNEVPLSGIEEYAKLKTAQ